MAEPTPVLLLGHSFLRRLHNYLIGIDYVNLGLSSGEFRLTWKGVGGLTIPGLFDYWEHIRELQPRVLVLEIGSNDLCDPKVSATALAVALNNFVSEVLDHFLFVRKVHLFCQMECT